jgi:zinc transport system substrate-binding protein
MKKTVLFLSVILLFSCGRNKIEPGSRMITVSIAPFKYFVEGIAGTEFSVNVMVPAGANPHIYEPYPDQVVNLTRSEAYISDGYLGFEMTWLDRFYELNRNMKKLSLGDKIDPIASREHHEGSHVEGADPHYWVSPACAFKMAAAIKEFLIGLDPQHRDLFEKNYGELYKKIESVDKKAKELSAAGKSRSFMIYHPNLAYLARDYGLEEIPVEYEGKEPSPARMKYLVDRAENEKLKIILVQREYDTKNARAIADETGGKVVIIDPLSEDWYAATMEIIDILRSEFENQLN